MIEQTFTKTTDWEIETSSKEEERKDAASFLILWVLIKICKCKKKRRLFFNDANYFQLLQIMRKYAFSQNFIIF